jgi:hypothetical protein
VFAVLRVPRAAGKPVLCLHSVSTASVSVWLPGMERFGTGRWVELVGEGLSARPTEGASLTLGPCESRWLGWGDQDDGSTDT